MLIYSIFVVLFMIPPCIVAIAPHASLQLWWCDQADPQQHFIVSTSTSTITTADGSLCVTYVPSSKTLHMEPCSSSKNNPNQIWNFNPNSSTFEGYPANLGCKAWNTQGGPGIEGPNSTLGYWSCNDLGFNSYFTPGFPFDSVISANFTSPSNETFSNLCLQAVNPLPLPIGTKEQIEWQLTEMGCFIHYNMATSAGTQGCNCKGAYPDISKWDNSALDTDSWISTGIKMGCKRFIYVAKHSCGFVTWKSSVSNYPYTIAQTKNHTDVVSQFVASAQKAGVGYGFYYSTVNNAYVKVCNNVVQSGSRYTQEEYNSIVLEHLTELWGNYGSLAEVWFDGGYNTKLTSNLTNLFSKLQPHVVAFQANGLMPSPVRWVGTESGLAPYPCWSTADKAGSGSPTSDQWFPAETDFTLQNGDNWFYNPHAGVHSPTDLRKMYEVSVGHNTALIIDFAPYPTGSLPQAQVDAAVTLGKYIHQCYDKPLLQTSGSGKNILELVPSAAVTIDRIVVQEDQTKGQLVRGFTIIGIKSDGSRHVLTKGTSIGNKFIQILATPSILTRITLNITSLATRSPVGSPFVKNFAVYSCSEIAAACDKEWSTLGHNVIET